MHTIGEMVSDNNYYSILDPIIKSNLDQQADLILLEIEILHKLDKKNMINAFYFEKYILSVIGQKISDLEIEASQVENNISKRELINNIEKLKKIIYKSEAVNDIIKKIENIGILDKPIQEEIQYDLGIEVENLSLSKKKLDLAISNLSHEYYHKHNLKGLYRLDTTKLDFNIDELHNQQKIIDNSENLFLKKLRNNSIELIFKEIKRDYNVEIDNYKFAIKNYKDKCKKLFDFEFNSKKQISIFEDKLKNFFNENFEAVFGKVQNLSQTELNYYHALYNIFTKKISDFKFAKELNLDFEKNYAKNKLLEKKLRQMLGISRNQILGEKYQNFLNLLYDALSVRYVVINSTNLSKEQLPQDKEKLKSQELLNEYIKIDYMNKLMRAVKTQRKNAIDNKRFGKFIYDYKMRCLENYLEKFLLKSKVNLKFANDKLEQNKSKKEIKKIKRHYMYLLKNDLKENSKKREFKAEINSVLESVIKFERNILLYVNNYLNEDEKVLTENEKEQLTKEYMEEKLLNAKCVEVYFELLKEEGQDNDKKFTQYKHLDIREIKHTKRLSNAINHHIIPILKKYWLKEKIIDYIQKAGLENNVDLQKIKNLSVVKNENLLIEYYEKANKILRNEFFNKIMTNKEFRSNIKQQIVNASFDALIVSKKNKMFVRELGSVSNLVAEIVKGIKYLENEYNDGIISKKEVALRINEMMLTLDIDSKFKTMQEAFKMFSAKSEFAAKNSYSVKDLFNELNYLIRKIVDFEKFVNILKVLSPYVVENTKSKFINLNSFLSFRNLQSKSIEAKSKIAYHENLSLKFIAQIFGDNLLDINYRNISNKLNEIVDSIDVNKLKLIRYSKQDLVDLKNKINLGETFKQNVELKSEKEKIESVSEKPFEKVAFDNIIFNDKLNESELDKNNAERKVDRAYMALEKTAKRVKDLFEEIKQAEHPLEKMSLDNAFLLKIEKNLEEVRSYLNKTPEYITKINDIFEKYNDLKTVNLDVSTWLQMKSKYNKINDEFIYIERKIQEQRIYNNNFQGLFFRIKDYERSVGQKINEFKKFKHHMLKYENIDLELTKFEKFVMHAEKEYQAIRHECATHNLSVKDVYVIHENAKTLEVHIHLFKYIYSDIPDIKIVTDFVSNNKNYISEKILKKVVENAVIEHNLEFVKSILKLKHLAIVKPVYYLHLACKHGDLAIAKYLINVEKIDVNSMGSNNNTPLHTAIKFERANIFEYLLSRFDVNVVAKDKDKNTPIKLAENSNNDVIRKLIMPYAKAELQLDSQKIKLKKVEHFGFFGKPFVYKDFHDELERYSLLHVFYEKKLLGLNEEIIKFAKLIKFLSRETDEIDADVKEFSNKYFTIEHFKEGEKFNSKDLSKVVNIFHNNMKIIRNSLDRFSPKIKKEYIDDYLKQDYDAIILSHISDIKDKLYKLRGKCNITKNILNGRINKLKVMFDSFLRGLISDSTKFKGIYAAFKKELQNIDTNFEIVSAFEKLVTTYYNSLFDEINKIEYAVSQLNLEFENLLKDVRAKKLHKEMKKDIDNLMSKWTEIKRKTNINYLADYKTRTQNHDLIDEVALYKAAKIGDTIKLDILITKSNFTKQELARAMFVAVRYNQINVIKFFIPTYFKINYSDENGNTALHVACKYADEFIVSYLLSEGADPKIQNIHKETPLHWGINNEKSKNIEVLLNSPYKRIDVSIKNEQRNTAIELAKSKKSIRRLVNRLKTYDTFKDSKIKPVPKPFFRIFKDPSYFVLQKLRNVLAKNDLRLYKLSKLVDEELIKFKQLQLLQAENINDSQADRLTIILDSIDKIKKTKNMIYEKLNEKFDLKNKSLKLEMFYKKATNKLYFSNEPTKLAFDEVIVVKDKSKVQNILNDGLTQINKMLAELDEKLSKFDNVITPYKKKFRRSFT